MDFLKSEEISRCKEIMTEPWTAPRLGWRKCNTNTTFREGRAAVVFVARDNRGKIDFLATKIHRCNSVVEIELHVEWAIRIAEGRKFNNILWSSDT